MLVAFIVNVFLGLKSEDFTQHKKLVPMISRMKPDSTTMKKMIG